MQLALVRTDPIPAQGDLHAVFEQHHAMVFRTAYRLTGNAHDAEDVLQTVFLRLLNRGDSSPIQQQESYLRRAAINVAVSLINEKRKAGATPLEDTAAGAPEDRELRETLRTAMAALDPRHAEMFALRYFEGLSNGEIAAAMGVSSIVVAVTLHRIRGRLKKELQNFLR